MCKPHNTPGTEDRFNKYLLTKQTKKLEFKKEKVNYHFYRRIILSFFMDKYNQIVYLDLIIYEFV